MLPLNKPKLLTLTISALLTACSSSSTGQGEATYTMRGTVPGTLIEAFCDDGRYFSTHSDMSAPQVRHPFDLELPVGLTCRLVMTTGEGTANEFVTPIGFIAADSSSIAFEGSDDINIGHVALMLEPDPGCAMVPSLPTYDLDCNGIQDEPIFIAIEADDFEVVTRVSDPLDDDRDNLVDAYEDDDGDGIPNLKDDNYGTDDNDGDGVDNADDVDDDNDGYRDEEDDDDDNDGIADDEDDDDDNDGIEDWYDEDHEDYDDHDEDEEDEEDDEDEEHDEDDDHGSAPTFTDDEPSAGRLLVATQCAQCHGTDGYSVTDIDSIAGESRRELLEETVEDANEPGNLMGFHGGAYLSLNPELEAIADYLSQQ